MRRFSYNKFFYNYLESLETDLKKKVGFYFKEFDKHELENLSNDLKEIYVRGMFYIDTIF